MLSVGGGGSDNVGRGDVCGFGKGRESDNVGRSDVCGFGKGEKATVLEV